MCNSLGTRNDALDADSDQLLNLFPKKVKYHFRTQVQPLAQRQEKWSSHRTLRRSELADSNGN